MVTRIPATDSVEIFGKNSENLPASLQRQSLAADGQKTVGAPDEPAPRCPIDATPLLAHHRAYLCGLGLSDSTIDGAGLFSISDPQEVARLLNFPLAAAADLGPCLVFPISGLDGQATDQCRLRPDRPRLDGDRLVEYEQRNDISLQPYLSPATIHAIQAANDPIGITSGEIGSMAASQGGWPCLSLPNAWSFQSGRQQPSKKTPGEWQLIEAFEWISWQDRIVWIAFAAGSRIDRDARYAEAELARVLTNRGARVFLVHIPVGDRGPDGLPRPMGLHDVLSLRGEDALRNLIATTVAPPPAPRSLTEYREEMAQNHLAIIGDPRMFLNNSPPGSGKSVANDAVRRDAARRIVRRSAAFLPTHANCIEEEDRLICLGFDAKAYPKLTKKNCQRYNEAAEVRDMGLMVSAVLCPTCSFRPSCPYAIRQEAAEKSAHCIATHDRGAVSCRSIMKGRDVAFIDEYPAKMLRPTSSAKSGLNEILAITHNAANTAQRFHEFDLLLYLQIMEAVAETLRDALNTATKTSAISLPMSAARPRSLDVNLFRAAKEMGLRPNEFAMRICIAAAAGDLETVAVRVGRRAKDGSAATARRAITAVWRCPVPSDVPALISDGTLTLDEAKRLAGREVIDITPTGTLGNCQPIIQVGIDVKMRTSPTRVAEIAEGVLLAFSGYQKIGIICHKGHVSIFDGSKSKSGIHLPPASRRRIFKTDYFRSGSSRASNSWIDAADGCDLLLVLGTPRVPPGAVEESLLRNGMIEAAARNGEWGAGHWSGQTADHRRITIETPSYADHDWQNAHEGLVHSELRQAAGRARAFSHIGIPVVVVSTEPLGFALCDPDRIQPLTRPEAEVLAAVRELTEQIPTRESRRKSLNLVEKLTEQIPIRITIGICSDAPVSTSSIAKRVELGEKRTRVILGDLRDRWLVVQVGERGGWTLPQPAAKADGGLPAPSSN